MLEAVRALAPRLRAASAWIDEQRRLPEELFAALCDIGVFKAHLPPSLGGRSATLCTLAPVIEEIARANGSAGWLAYVGSEALRQTLRLPTEIAQRITASPRAFIAGMFTPGSSRAVPEPGGYRVSGQWHTCSGSLHADWILAGTTVVGSPARRLNFIPISEVKILDTWHVSGLKGTNSNDLEVQDVFVPEAYGAYDVEPPDLGLHLMVPLGIARGAIDEFIDLASRRGPSKLGPDARYRDLPAVQREVAAAEAALRAARTYALAALADVDARAAAGLPTSTEERDDFFLAAAHAAQASVDVVDGLHRAAGTASIFTTSHLQRAFQDVHVAVAHVSLQPVNLELVGRHLLEVRPTSHFSARVAVGRTS